MDLQIWLLPGSRSLLITRDRQVFSLENYRKIGWFVEWQIECRIVGLFKKRNVDSNATFYHRYFYLLFPFKSDRIDGKSSERKVNA